MERFADQMTFSEFKLKKNAQALVAEGMVGGEKVVAVLPEVFMNVSGKSALALVKSKAAAKKLIVVRDDLDMPLGSIKITVPGRGTGGHKGVESIARALKTKDFIQMKIGISGKTAKGRVKKVSGEDAVVKHVIGTFKPSEKAALDASLAKAVGALEVLIASGIEKAMLVANTK